MVARTVRRRLRDAVRRVAARRARSPRRPVAPHQGGDPAPSAATPPWTGPPAPYPYVRLGALGATEAVEPWATAVADRGGPPGVDVVTVAGASRGGPSRLDPRTVDAMIDCERAGVPTVLLADQASDLTTPVAAACWGIATRDPDVHGLAEGQVGAERTALLPLRVDTRVCNPVGAPDQPAGPVLLLTGDDRAGDHSVGELEQDLAARGLPTRVHALTDAAGDGRLVALARRCPVAVLAFDDADATVWARVLALVAAGTLVVGPRDVPDRVRPALVAADGVAVGELAATLVADRDRRTVESVRTRRHVLAQHSELRWLEQLLAAAGVPTQPAELVSAVVPVRDPQRLPATTANTARQTHRVLEVVLVADATQAAACEEHAAGAPATRVAVLPAGASRADRLNAGVNAAHGGWVAFLEDTAVYGPDHVADLLSAAGYAHADLVGRAERFVHDPGLGRTAVRGAGRAERPAASVPLGTALLRRETALRFGFLRGTAHRPLAARLRAAGGTVYSAHRYEALLDGRIPPAELASDATRLFPGRAVDHALPFGDGGVPVPPPEPNTRRDERS